MERFQPSQLKKGGFWSGMAVPTRASKGVWGRVPLGKILRSPLKDVSLLTCVLSVICQADYTLDQMTEYL